MFCIPDITYISFLSSSPILCSPIYIRALLFFSHYIFYIFSLHISHTCLYYYLYIHCTLLLDNVYNNFYVHLFFFLLFTFLLSFLTFSCFLTTILSSLFNIRLFLYLFFLPSLYFFLYTRASLLSLLNILHISPLRNFYNIFFHLSSYFPP